MIFLYKRIHGVAESTFGTHAANLAGVPLDVVERAALISNDIAKQFKKKLRIRYASSKMPLVAQADFAYLFKLGIGEVELPEDTLKRKEILVRLKEIACCYLKNLRSLRPILSCSIAVLTLHAFSIQSNPS